MNEVKPGDRRIDRSSLLAGFAGIGAANTVGGTLLARAFSTTSDALIATTEYGKDSASDLYFRISADRGPRTNAIAQAQAKLDQASGDVYMYNFAWNTPIASGKFRAFHTSELPLAMRLVLNPEAEELSKQLAGPRAGFARSGDPNHSGLPHWEKYSKTKKSTMVFDVGKTALVDQPAQEELALLAAFPGGTSIAKILVKIRK